MANTYKWMGQSVGALKDRPVSELQEAFHKWIQLPDCSEKHGRERLFTTARTFWLFLSQILSEKSSCREAVRRFLAWLALEAERGASPNTAAYCKARARLEQKYLKEINGQIVTTALAAETEKNLWHGHRVKVIDGSGISMPDTPENQKVWPQPKGAKPGCSYPVIRMVAVFSLATGALIAMAKGRLKVSERNLFRRLWDRFEPNDVALADRGFCGYADFYFLVRRGVACVMRNNQRRMVGISLVKRINKNDRLVEWHKMRPCPKWLDKKAWDAVPERMTVREVTFSVDIPGFRTERIIIVTTLLDLKKYTASDFTDLYLRRWRAELYLRDIKTTMGMDILTCKTPKMINKELQMYLIAYNLIRLLMQEASCTYGTPPDRISFMGVIATVRTWAIALVCRGLSRAKRALLYELMLLYIIKDQLPIRQCRSEPRAKKRRPKSYQLLTKPRHLFKEVPHKSKYSKLLS